MHAKSEIPTFARASLWVVNCCRQASNVSDQLRWPSLIERQKRTRLSTFFKFHQGDIKIDTSNAPRLLNPGYNTRRSHKEYAMEPSSQNYRKYSFPFTIKEFNELPHDISICLGGGLPLVCFVPAPHPTHLTGRAHYYPLSKPEPYCMPVEDMAFLTAS